MPPLLDSEAVRQRLQRRFRRQRSAWLQGLGSWPQTLPLGLPTERSALADLAAVRRWAEQWARWDGPGTVHWVERRWPSAGTQRLPARLVFTDPATIADWLGEGARWRQARRRHALLSEAFPALSESLASEIDWLMTAPEADFQRLHDLLAWLVAHPRSGLYLRQLPIAGLDSKWAEAHRGLLTRLLRALHGTSGGDFLQLAGLRREPALLRLRLLDPALRAPLGGLGDLSAPLADIARLPLRPALAFIVENLRTGLAFEALPGAVVFMARGYAVEAYGQIPWLRDLPVYYWGDIDTHGFAILDRVRHYLPQVRALLMDEATLLTHRALWSHEARPAAAETLTRLTPEEQALYARLRQNHWRPGVRLEQERIGWEWAWRRVQAICQRHAVS